MATFDDLATPCLLLDRERMQRNIQRLHARIAGLGAQLRPHLKTCKSVEIARLMLAGAPGPATVSTLREAEVFAAAGVRDMIYAVGIAPQKLTRVEGLRAQGVDLAVILDSLEQAEAVAARHRASGRVIPALIEIDTDGHRAGVAPADADRLCALAARLGGQGLRGVLTHAGGSYHAHGAAALERAAEAERAGAAQAAAILREAGFRCLVVSVGSTPTAHCARTLDGVTEVRAGVYVFFDLMMASLGICTLDDIAISVLATVIGHRPAALGGAAITDAGWMALSRDAGFSPAAQPLYGQVCALDGQPIPAASIIEASQEHGVIAPQAPPLAIGDRVRILPNHACATAAQFDRYHVLGPGGAREAEWPRFSGW